MTGILRWVLAIAVGLLAGVWEAGMLPFVDGPFSFRPILPIAVILLVSSSRGKAYAAALSGAAFLDAYGWSSADMHMLRYMLILFILDLAAERLLTNRSVYAASAMAFSARILDIISSFITGTAGYFIGFSSEPWHLPSNILWTMLWDMGITAATFLVIAGLTKRFVTVARSDQRL
ncbi:hypothetical protein IT407_00645 [Candidatus Uhrbacteria bacterium]|nr:hypothetical protein [Candidatus Uhrbacteria bacterium]